MKDGLRSEKAKLDGEMCGDWFDLGAPLMSTPTALVDSAVSLSSIFIFVYISLRKYSGLLAQTCMGLTLGLHWNP
jgi:hypothetical protein